MQTKEEMVALAKQTARQKGIDPALFCALCHQESRFKQYAHRHEPAFYDRYISHMKGLTDTEMRDRAYSYGLTQIMGQTARELGFSGDDLSELYEPPLSLEFGARKFLQCMRLKNQDVRLALLCYNGGGDPTYPDKVLRFVGLYQ